MSYKTAFVLAHKLREAMAADQAAYQPKGEVEVDGAYFGGHIKPANRKENRKDRRLASNQTGKWQVVVAMRERGGRTLPFVVKGEEEAVAIIASRVAHGSTIYADEATHWDALHARFDAKRINHTVAYSTSEACTNLAESFFSRLRRAEIGQHHHISGPYLKFYAGEMAWREDMRRDDNGAKYQRARINALGHEEPDVVRVLATACDLECKLQALLPGACPLGRLDRTGSTRFRLELLPIKPVDDALLIGVRVPHEPSKASVARRSGRVPSVSVHHRNRRDETQMRAG